ncbi:hypothetical protein [Actinomycetospora soli]|uniref:hypothetical protein n=1 Tax=Actinomycetospora soli TaxID=2893887 RepID=UPI001E64F11A|nr:hypothetical protein [Actinomycetospora soli]MCD2191633.1 hypothetical protein [Actinomycetospora soli]
MVDAWERIAAWCSEHAPETAAAIRPSVGENTFNEVHRSTFAPWPEPLWAFYRWCDGTDRTPAGYLFPGFRPLPLLESLQAWRTLMSVFFPATAPPSSTPQDELERAFTGQLNALYNGDDAEFHAAVAAPAGSPTGGFLPVLLPIAEDQSGSFLVCDLRRKPRSHYGAIAVFDGDEGYSRPAPWRSFTALATATATALRTGDLVAGTRRRPVALGGRLTWTSAELDPLDHRGGVTADLTPGAAWKRLPGTDLQVKALMVEGRVQLSYRRTPS